MDAAFVPPPPSAVPALLEDLCAYVSGDDHSALVQAALAHAWFETIHPFADGNGRTGRALLQLVLRRRGLCRRFVPPISLVLATRSKEYVAALMGTRVEGAGDDPKLREGLNGWLELVAGAARVACAQAHAYETRIEVLVNDWRTRVAQTHGPLRADAAVWTLLAMLPAASLLTATVAVGLTGRSARAVGGALAQLVTAGVLKQVSGRIRYRVYEAAGVFDLVTDTERALASPHGGSWDARPFVSLTGRRPPVHARGRIGGASRSPHPRCTTTSR